MESGNDPAKAVLLIGALAGAGYVAYRHWYLPAKLREDLQREMALRNISLRQNETHLGVLGRTACQALGAARGLNPAASYGVCGELSGAVVGILEDAWNVVASPFKSTKVCRGPNNKDVFPNDMGMCRQLGITTCNDCAMQYNVFTGRWPWTA